MLNRRSAPDTGTATIENTGDRPVQIGSHIHLPDVNDALSFDRRGATGFRLDVPAGTSVRFEPGASRTVAIVRLGGRKRVPGLQIREEAAAAEAARSDEGSSPDAGESGAEAGEG